MKLHIALIHNNNDSRNAYLLPMIDSLASDLREEFAVEFHNFSYQPAFRPHKLSMALFRDLYYTKLGVFWSRYRGHCFLCQIKICFDFAKNIIKKYLLNFRNSGSKWKRNSAIEMMVTEKHLRAWGTFVDSEADYLFCFEDDVVFMDDSLPRLKEFLKHLSAEFSSNERIYVDLAGGLGETQLKVKTLERSMENGFKTYTRPVTNTACGYLISKGLVRSFYDVLSEKPLLRLIGIDWMMNGLFISLINRDIQVFCLHACPTLFKHGTFTGDYVSWQND